jgi:homoserine O-acetyltransferase
VEGTAGAPSNAPLPATGAWRPGDAPGQRRFLEVFVDEPLALELGGELGGVEAPICVAYETWGTCAPDGSNVVLVLHALTGDSHAAGSAGPGHDADGWWAPLIGPGCAIDTDKFHVIAANVLGGCQGTTGPSSIAGDGLPYGGRFPMVTIRDQVAVELALLDALGIETLHAVVGGSMGGMRALELALMAPDRVERLVLLACGPAATAEQIALVHAQLEAIELDPAWRGGDYYDASPGTGPWRGLGVARRIGQISYRTREEFSERFGRDLQVPGELAVDSRYAVESYLDHHAAKLARRFDANSYRVLSKAMNHHDVGRGRGGVLAALRSITTPTTVIGFDSDRLYPPVDQQVLAEYISGADELHLLTSPLGHDAFLLEIEAISPIVAAALA